MPVLFMPPPNAEDLFIAQLVNQQQQLLNKLFQIAALPADDDAGELFDTLMAMEDERCGAVRPPQGGRRITEEVVRSMGSEECRWHFRFDAEELIQLAHSLDIPNPFITRTASRFSSLEAFALLCARFKTSGDIFFLVMLFDRSQSAISEVINELAMFLNERWAHLFRFPHESLLSPDKLQSYANAIHQAGAPIPTVWGFIDCTIRQICRPTQHQREAYNGHKKFHAQKFQAVVLPNGLICHLFGPYEGRHHDRYLLTDSHLLEDCLQYALQPGSQCDDPPHRRYFQIFGDPAYGVSPVMMSPFSGNHRTAQQLAWNAQMGKVRIEVEHVFGILGNLWPFIKAHWKMRAYSSPIGCYYRTAALLTNVYTCFRGSQISQAFNCPPPSLEEYLVDRPHAL